MVYILLNPQNRHHRYGDFVPKGMRNMKKRCAGFTLIELMIVVAIVGILAAIAIPSYSSYRTKARLSQVTATLDALATGAEEYHSIVAYFPAAINNAANIRATFGQFNVRYVSNIVWTQTDTDNGAFQVTIGNVDSDVNGCQLNLNLSYASASGYDKIWTGDLDGKYMPIK